MSIYSIAYTGLNAFQRALQVVGNNIANQATRGYSRQTVHLQAGVTQKYAGSYIGTGVAATNVFRNTDQFATNQIRGTLTAKSEYENFYLQAAQIDKLLSQDGTSISKTMQSFFDSLSQLNNAPADSSARDVALKQSQMLAQQFNFLQGKLDEYQNNSTQQITQSVNEINKITQGIAACNQQLMASPNAPELLDQRDELLKELSAFVDVSSFDQNDGTISVAIASGEMLVAGTEQRNLIVSTDRSSTLGTKVVLDNGAGQVDISDKLVTGKLGGLMNYEHTIIGQASQILGQMAIGLSQKFNAQHQLGMDMNNQIGQKFFTDFNAMDIQLRRSITSASNTGTATLAVSISDISQTKLSDYQLVITDAATNQARLISKTDGTSTNVTWSSSPPAPPAGQVQLDGMTITVDNIANLATNDTFTLTPTRGAASDMAVLLTKVDQLALASPVKTSAALTNTGKGDIALGTILNTTGVDKQYQIQFISDTQYQIVNVTDSLTSGPFSFTPNTNNTVQIPDSVNPSYTVTLSGLPAAGDTFTATYNAGGIGDNRNGLNLFGIQQSKMFSGGTTSLNDVYSDLLANVGAQTSNAKIGLDSADILYKQAVDFAESKSGVNLDEEAANLLKFKQAYEAAGKLMEISSQIMNTLIQIMR